MIDRWEKTYLNGDNPGEEGEGTQSSWSRPKRLRLDGTENIILAFDDSNSEEEFSPCSSESISTDEESTNDVHRNSKHLSESLPPVVGVI